MASLCGLNILALTDHNTAKNCPAFFAAAKKYDIIPIAGMELTTSEDIHVICLFENLSDALSFDDFVESNRIKVKNRPEIFGHQTVMNDDDEPLFEVEDLLIYASNISIENVSEVVSSYGGICYPAHIDRDANGIIAILGTLPDYGFDLYELNDGSKKEKYSVKYNIDKDRFIVSSDAHYLTAIKDKENYLDLDCNGNDPQTVRRCLFRYLRRK